MHERLDPGPTLSALCRSVTKDGWKLDVVIYADGEGQWSLEVVDDAGTSTCWLELFDTEEQALAEALTTIEENGIEEFHMAQPWREN